MSSRDVTLMRLMKATLEVGERVVQLDRLSCGLVLVTVDGEGREARIDDLEDAEAGALQMLERCGEAWRYDNNYVWLLYQVSGVV